MNIKIEITTRHHTDYVTDRVTFESDGDYVEINHEGHIIEIRKRELCKVADLL